MLRWPREPLQFTIFLNSALFCHYFWVPMNSSKTSIDITSSFLFIFLIFRFLI